MIEEFLVYKGFIYKKVGDLGCIVKACSFCNMQFFTKEQRKMYCSNVCKTRAYRDRHKCK
jgi:hypothetical protein